MSENTNKHTYTCLASPPELEQLGLTHMVCRVDMQDRPVAAFNSSAAASNMCDQLNNFAKQDRPELDPDAAQKQLDEANRIAALNELKQKTEAASRLSAAQAESEKTLAAQEPKVIALDVAQKIAAAQAALATK